MEERKIEWPGTKPPEGYVVGNARDGKREYRMAPRGTAHRMEMVWECKEAADRYGTRNKMAPDVYRFIGIVKWAKDKNTQEFIVMQYRLKVTTGVAFKNKDKEYDRDMISLKVIPTRFSPFFSFYPFW
jgi:hypothetical protein